jgi:hypothetical protein
MIYEGCEILTAHYRDGTMGVNALRSTVPLAAGDPPIETITVFSEFEVPYLAGGRIPDSAYESGPLCLVRRGDEVGEYSAPGHPELLSDDSRLRIDTLLFFPRRQARDIHHENRCLSALLRIVRRSIGLLFESVPADERALRDVQLTALLAGPRLVPTIHQVSETDLLAGAVIAEFKALDRWAEGITT